MRKRLCQISNIVNNGDQVFGFATDTQTAETVFIRTPFIEANDITANDVGENFFCYAQKKTPDDEKGPIMITFLGWQDEPNDGDEIDSLREQLDATRKELASLKSAIRAAVGMANDG